VVGKRGLPVLLLVSLVWSAVVTEWERRGGAGPAGCGEAGDEEAGDWWWWFTTTSTFSAAATPDDEATSEGVLLKAEDVTVNGGSLFSLQLGGGTMKRETPNGNGPMDNTRRATGSEISGGRGGAWIASFSDEARMNRLLFIDKEGRSTRSHSNRPSSQLPSQRERERAHNAGRW
jgi:hypothetical protein